MRPKYAVYKTHKNELNSSSLPDQEEAYHVRFVPRSTINAHQLAHELESEGNFKQENTLSFLSVLTQYIERKNSQGHIVKIDGLGSFVPSITTTEPVTAPDMIKNTQVKVNDINFRADRQLLRRMKQVDFVRDWEHGNCSMDATMRQERIVAYFEQRIEASNQNDCWLSRKTIMDLNKCSRQTALADLNALIAQGELRQIGQGRTVLYGRG